MVDGGVGLLSDSSQLVFGVRLLPSAADAGIGGRWIPIRLFDHPDGLSLIIASMTVWSSTGGSEVRSCRKSGR